MTKEKQTLENAIKPIENNAIIFDLQNYSYKLMIELKNNGDIFVNEKLIENDKEIVNGMRDLISEQQSKHEQEMEEFYEFMKDYDFIDDSSAGKLYANTNMIGSSQCYTITELLTKFKNR